jgi:hypothetical protein
MTDEDLRKTVADIRQASHDVDMVKSMLETAADELEWLKSIVQSYERSVPVAWRWRWHSDPPDVWNFADNEFHSELMTIEPLYTARPQPGSGSKL